MRGAGAALRISIAPGDGSRSRGSKAPGGWSCELRLWLTISARRRPGGRVCERSFSLSSKLCREGKRAGPVRVLQAELLGAQRGGPAAERRGRARRGRRPRRWLRRSGSVGRSLGAPAEQPRAAHHCSSRSSFAQGGKRGGAGRCESPLRRQQIPEPRGAGGSLGSCWRYRSSCSQDGDGGM